CHQNPVAWPELSAGAAPPPYASATDDELLNADIVGTLMEAAYAGTGAAERGRLLAGADELRDRLFAREPAFFAPTGNRVEGGGDRRWGRAGPPPGPGSRLGCAASAWTRARGCGSPPGRGSSTTVRRPARGAEPVQGTNRTRVGKYVRTLAPPVVVLAVLIGWL